MQFYPSKEYMKTIYPSRDVGDDFKILGALFGTRLTMQAYLESVLTKTRPPNRALLRLKDLYTRFSMLKQYNGKRVKKKKNHMWSITEYSNGVLILGSLPADFTA